MPLARLAMENGKPMEGRTSLNENTSSFADFGFASAAGRATYMKNFDLLYYWLNKTCIGLQFASVLYIWFLPYRCTGLYLEWA